MAHDKKPIGERARARAGWLCAWHAWPKCESGGRAGAGEGRQRRPGRLCSQRICLPRALLRSLRQPEPRPADRLPAGRPARPPAPARC